MTPLPLRAALLAVLLPACAGAVRPAALVKAGPGDGGTRILGLDACTPGGAGRLTLDPDRPLTLFVHGCKDSGGRFRELAQVFEAHGQQTACFNYDHRRSIDDTAGDLVQALEALQAKLRPGQLTVLAHSQGGLVARRALVAERGAPLRAADGFTYRLFTVSSPFGGIRASSHCGARWLHWVTLGITALVCQAVAGSNWTEIPPGSTMTRHPGTLGPEVQAALKVVTDERGSCRRRGDDGACREDDYVFSVREQQNPAVDADPRLAVEVVQAGHVEIVGGEGVVPAKLVAVLQQHGILARTPPERREEIAALLARLFGADGAR